MKKQAALYGSAAALVAGGLFLAWDRSAPTHVDAPHVSANASDAAANGGVRPIDAAHADPLVEAGTLWETDAENPREAQRSVIQIAAEPLRNALAAAPGTRLSLALSTHFAPLEATVASSGTQADGTIITSLRIEGAPQGVLTLQENRKDGFFIGHLFYGNDYPIAYEFRKKGDTVEAVRHAVPDLVCSELDRDQQRVASRGLPSTAQAGAPPSVKGANAKTKAQTKGIKIAVSDVTVNETDSGPISMTFNVRLSKADRKKTIKVNYATENDTALAGTDYQSTSGTLSFPPKSTVQTITVPIPCDDLAETNKSFKLKLSAPENATLVNDTATGTIIDDDATPELSVDDIIVAETNSGATEARIPVSLKQAYVATVSVKCSTHEVTAIAGVDYDDVEGTIVFKPGETRKYIPTNVYGDRVQEGTETFRVSLSNPEGGAVITRAEGTVSIVDNGAFVSNVPDLNSLPGAESVIYLDFDGQVVTNTLWNTKYIIDSFFTYEKPILAEGINGYMDASQMTAIWKSVAEDFAPFHATVTTNEAVYLAAPPSRRIRCIVTPSSSWFDYDIEPLRAGGVAYVGSFIWSGDTPCWVFANNLAYFPKYIAEAVSHEVGHTLGLNHDGRVKPAEEYYEGQGSGQTSWAPIMGVGYYSTIVQWSKGEYAQANNLEDDLAIITGQNNGFGYRRDDVGNTDETATAMAVNGNLRTAKGIIETRNDVDVFSFTTTGGAVSLNIQGDVTSQNLDILAELYDANHQLVGSYNPDALTNASISTTLGAGTYYLHVSGVGRGDPKSDGYSDYDSLGQYSISGIVP